MKLRFGGRFYGALIVVMLAGAACSSAPSKEVGQTQAGLTPQAEARTLESNIPADSLVTPKPEVKVKPAPKAAAARKPAAPKPSAQPKPAYTPPAVIEPEPQAVIESEPGPVANRTPAAPVDRRITIPSGTLVAIRMVDSISSDEDHAGQTFRASLDAPVVVDGETVIPKRADAFVKIAAAKAAGELTGKPELKVQLDSIVLDGRRYTINSNVFLREGASQTVQTAKSAGIGALIGGAIGAITGGKKGAAIGAGVGAGGGVAVEAASKNEQARIESETRIDFRLESPLDVYLK
jgi:hypothetical protein